MSPKWAFLRFRKTMSAGKPTLGYEVTSQGEPCLLYKVLSKGNCKALCFRMLICDDKTGGEWKEVPKVKSPGDFYFTITESHVYLYTLHFSRIIVLGPPTLRTMIFGCLNFPSEKESKLELEVHLFNNAAKLKEV